MSHHGTSIALQLRSTAYASAQLFIHSSVQFGYIHEVTLLRFEPELDGYRLARFRVSTVS